MARWSDKSHEDRQPEDPKHPAGPASKPETQRADGTQRHVEHEPHRWRRGDQPTTAAEWEVAQFHDSFGGFDAPRA